MATFAAQCETSQQPTRTTRFFSFLLSFFLPVSPRRRQFGVAFLLLGSADFGGYLLLGELDELFQIQPANGSADADADFRGYLVLGGFDEPSKWANRNGADADGYGLFTILLYRSMYMVCAEYIAMYRT
ncbi:hypothetical protein BZA05DRAFT_402965 [Tricharina praecox]|uniref:uncharacterized protein n=1 Tax=Tricharina praecox TaxID=43433 RepID=UPI00221F9C2D|nr:uncharacterized protein BZA05DRAFT_402965 [Tricharina praecox]KAI5848864.1 hypothetical protein BZA05DRAFT_402965 [Tricharina praecox]